MRAITRQDCKTLADLRKFLNDIEGALGSLDNIHLKGDGESAMATLHTVNDASTAAGARIVLSIQ